MKHWQRGMAALVLTACAAVGSAERGAPSTTTTASPSYALRPGGRSLRFAVIGDYGVDSRSESAVALLVAGWNPEFVMTLGDNNYPLGLPMTVDRNIGRYYQHFIGHYSGAFGQGSHENRFWPTPGNHDWYGPQGITPYTDYFTLPGNERYYDVDLGLLHLFSVDSDEREPDGITADSVQAKWLKERMAASSACFKVVYFHHPPYSSGSHGNNVNLQWPFKQWGADVVLTGHDHTYERLEKDGLPYIVNGLGGAPMYQFDDVKPESKVRYNRSPGAQLVTVTERSMTLEMRDTRDQIVDVLRIEKNCRARR